MVPVICWSFYHDARSILTAIGGGGVLWGDMSDGDSSSSSTSMEEEASQNLLCTYGKEMPRRP